MRGRTFVEGFIFCIHHSVVYDPISAHYFPCGYDQNITMEYESIQFI